VALRRGLGREKAISRPIGSLTIGEAAQSNGTPAGVDDELEVEC
jgi:hypothetical protein